MCVWSSSKELRAASHSTVTMIRTWRAECALATGDAESAVGNLKWVGDFFFFFFQHVG